MVANKMEENKMAQKGTSTDTGSPFKQATDEQVAAFDLGAARVQLMLNEPFFAHILRGVTFVKTEQIPTAGVLAKDGEITCWWNPRFLAALSKDEVQGILKREAYHLVFGHTTTRRMEPHKVHYYATDLAINSDIPEKELFFNKEITGIDISIVFHYKILVAIIIHVTYGSISI